MTNHWRWCSRCSKLYYTTAGICHRCGRAFPPVGVDWSRYEQTTNRQDALVEVNTEAQQEAQEQ